MTIESSKFPASPPYNPWRSYLVEASAGSGKTWQLSRRFLALVVAGADPSSILTVTFTRKAAAEMRERIIGDAVRLGQGDPEFSGFVQSIRQWQPPELSAPAPLRTAQEASKLIIEKTQTLRITTIDALFMQWVQQFPLETALTREGAEGSVTLQSPWDLLSNLAQQRLEQRAWNNVLAMAVDHKDNRELMRSISIHAPGGSIKQLNRAIAPIMNSDTFLWSVALNTGESPAKSYATTEALVSDEEFLDQHRPLFYEVLNLVTNADKKSSALDCLANNDLPGLIKCQIINSRRDSLSGTTFRSAAAKQNPSFIKLSNELLSWDTETKLIGLNNTAKLLWSLYHAKESQLHQIKSSEAKGTFSDAVKGVSLMATSDGAIGARAMAWSHIRHLMLDEFQDTSKLQWIIFERLAKELLSGGNASFPPPSVFIVGDKKQSIYRFREADPALMEEAKNSLSPLGLSASVMSESYRSSSLVLDLVNAVFADHSLIRDFPIHAPAAARLKSSSNRAEYGSLTIYPEAEGLQDQGKSITASHHQAKQIASHIRDAINGKLGIKVFDDESKTWRTPVYSDFVVLYPKKTHAHLIEEELRELAIPCQKEERHGFFERSEIIDLRALVTWLTWPADAVALCTVLRSPIFNLSDEDLQKALSDGSDYLISKLKVSHRDIYDQLLQLRSTHRRETLASLIGHLITHHKITDRYEQAFGPVEGPLARANILKWFDMVRSQSADEALDAQSWTLAMDDAAEEDETGNAALATNAVSLMTIHKSKGLEFPCVIVADLASDWHKPETGWVKDTRPGKEGLWFIGTDKTRPKASEDLNELLAINEAESRDEKARLLYVALTRASTHLVITGAKPKKPCDDSYFVRIAEAGRSLPNTVSATLPGEAVMYRRGTVDTAAELRDFTDNLTSLATPQIPLNSTRPGLLILTPSAKALDSSEQTPPEQASRVLHAALAEPQPFSSAVGKVFGTLVHKLIENHLTHVQWSDHRLLRLIPSSLKRSENIDEQNLLRRAKEDVTRLIESSPWLQLMAEATETFTEVPLAGIEGDSFINAKADLILRDDDGRVTVVDFKTIELRSSDIEESTLQALSSELGYSHQVSQYCKLAGGAFNCKKTRGLVLFTRAARLIQVC